MELVYRHDVTGLNDEECAAMVGIKPSSWRSLVTRGYAPPAWGYDSETGRRIWEPVAVMRFIDNRPGQGRGPRRSKPKAPKRKYSKPRAKPIDQLD